MNLKTKKIIAREGLIILCFVLSFYFMVLLANKNPNNNLFYNLPNIIFGYPIYLLIRFVAWISKTWNVKIKRIIAKEGLLFLGSIIISVVVLIFPLSRYKEGWTDTFIQTRTIAYCILHIEIGVLVLFTVTIDLFAHFALWAIKILKQK